jgi:hypothetical protein
MSFYDDASWLLIPSGIKEDVVYAQKPTSGLGDLSFSRASDATYTDAGGVVRRSPYNLVTWSEMFSDVAWAKTNTSISANVTTAPNGTLTADKIIAANGTSIVGDHIQQNVTKGASAISYTFTTYAKASELNGIRILVRDSISVANRAQVYFNLSTGAIDTAAESSGTFSNASATITANENGWYRVSLTFTSSTDTQVQPRIYTYDTVKTTGNGTDGTFIWGAQLVEGTSALDYFPTTNRQDVPRIDFRNADGTLSSCGRLLLEPQRTNSTRNSSMVGAVAGTPGTLPTNWVGGSAAGLTRTIVGVGTENGLPYIDFRYNGTSATTTIVFVLDSLGAITASAGQSWNFSSYLRLVSGTIDSAQLFWDEYNGATYLNSKSTSISVNSTLSRFSLTGTTAVNCNTLNPFIRVLITNGAAYDFTIRIAAPQMELGSYATTWVPTTTAAVTRIADVASKTGVSSLIGQTEGTIYWEGFLSPGADDTFTFNLSAGNTVIIAKNVSNQVQARIIANSAQTSLSTTTTHNGFTKIALGYKSENTVLYVNGNLASVSSNSYTFSAALSVINLAFGSTVFFGFEKKETTQAALFPTRLTNAQLAQLTTL